MRSDSGTAGHLQARRGMSHVLISRQLPPMQLSTSTLIMCSPLLPNHSSLSPTWSPLSFLVSLSPIPIISLPPPLTGTLTTTLVSVSLKSCSPSTMTRGPSWRWTQETKQEHLSPSHLEHHWNMDENCMKTCRTRIRNEEWNSMSIILDLSCWNIIRILCLYSSISWSAMCARAMYSCNWP